MLLLSLFVAIVSTSSIHNNFNKYVYKYDSFPAAQQRYQIMPFHIKHNRINLAEGNIHINDMNVRKIKLDQAKDNECKYSDMFLLTYKVNDVRADTFLHCNIF